MTSRDLLDSGGYVLVSMKNMLSQIIRSSVLGIAALLALIFIPAGTLQYWQGWAYVVIAIVASGAYVKWETVSDQFGGYPIRYATTGELAEGMEQSCLTHRRRPQTAHDDLRQHLASRELQR